MGVGSAPRPPSLTPSRVVAQGPSDVGEEGWRVGGGLECVEGVWSGWRRVGMGGWMVVCLIGWVIVCLVG